MLVVAISVKDQEYFYKASSAHKVSKASAERICRALNEANYQLKPGETWAVHDVGPWDKAAVYAADRPARIYKNHVKLYN